MKPAAAAGAMWRRSLPYTEDTATLFERLLGRPGAVFLDSGAARGGQGRYDILAADPGSLIRSRDGHTTVESAGGGRRDHSGDPFEVVRAHIWDREYLDCAPRDCAPCPFQTGAIGYFGYDLGRRIERLPQIAADRERVPEILLGIYDWAAIADHRRRELSLVGRPGERFGQDDFEAVLRLLSAPAPAAPAHPPPAACRIRSPPVANMDRRGYIERFQTIQGYIRSGDCYQVNLAQKFTVEIECDPWQLYRRLRQLNPAPFSAYLDFGDLQVLSISPENFLRLRGSHVQTLPVKGTRPRRRTPEQDRREIEALRHSDKDRAENLMIVDLLRNDIGKNCSPGSIRVSRLFDIESFANVHHMVSAIEGELAADRDALHLLQGCFPGGSITGAPKLRSMEIIEELEPDRRGVYCGAIGYLSRHGDMDLSVAIRTACHLPGRVVFHGGGGIVADSVAEAEYQETLDKVSSMMRLFGAPGG